MIEVVDTLQILGRESNIILLPIILWTFIAIILKLSVWKENVSPVYQLQSRVMLLVALPAGVLGSAVIQWASSFSGIPSGSAAKFIVIQSPITISPAGSTVHTAGIPWGDPFLWLGFLLFILLAGSLLSLAFHLWNLFQLRQLSKMLTFIPLKQLLNQKEIPLSCDETTNIAFSDRIQVPFTYGYLQPHIVLPESLRSSKQDLFMVLKHELMHVKQRDFLINNILSFIRCLFWFHPLTYLLQRECNEYREISCDHKVIADPKISKKSYARLLYRLAVQSNKNNQVFISMAVNPSTLKNRIKMMNNQPNTFITTRKSIFLMGLATFLMVGVMACSDLQEDTDTTDVEEVQPVPAESPEASKAEDGDFFVAVEEMPELKGGLAALQQEIEYPEEARNAGIEGRVISQFVVTEEGTVEDPEIIRGIGGGADEEALRVVSEAEFKPGKQKGEPVRVLYSLPITFKLSADE